MSLVDFLPEMIPQSPLRKRGKAARPEAMDILDRLRDEHRVVKGLLNDMLDTKSGPKRTKLFAELRKALIPHARAEEKAVYDRLLKVRHEDTQVMGHEGYFEHEIADKLITKLKSSRDKSSREWTAGIKVLKEMLEHHIKEEEREIFDLVKENFTTAQRMEMDAAFERFKKRVRVS